MRLLRAGHGVTPPLNCGVMWPDPKESECVETSAFARAEDSSFTRRFAAEPFFLLAGGERRCIIPALSNVGFRTLGRVFVSAAHDRGSHDRAHGSADSSA
jgi:hypothetical protein